ncbi:MAG: amidohydrolase [Anaerolineae bacterium]|nr:amidohydrolase [Thermoflexales bacterium]MDW8407114.1 amidohydrolase [Anaerolineae bacterium]
MERLRREAEARRDRLIATRRDLHAHPEIAFQEIRTADIVAHRLAELGFEVQTGVGKTGVVGVMEGERAGDGHTLLLRFDMDALPIHEQVDVPFRSQRDGWMHACGHDAHTAIGLSVAELLAADRAAWSGTAKFVFQPAEEIVAGARAMIDDGVLENPRPDRALSLHVFSTLPTGVIAMTDGPTMAGSGAFTITVRGRGAHGAMPHQGADPILGAAHIITALQSIVSRNVNPMEQAVVTVGYVHGGTAHNIIPDDVELGGTTRAFSTAVGDLLNQRIQEIAQHTARALGVEAVVSISESATPPLINDAGLAEVVRRQARRLVGAEHVRTDVRLMGAEDAALFLQAMPGAYVFVGAGNPAKGIDEPHHSPRFQIDEDALPIAVALLTASAIDMLND